MTVRTQRRHAVPRTKGSPLTAMMMSKYGDSFVLGSHESTRNPNVFSFRVENMAIVAVDMRDRLCTARRRGDLGFAVAACADPESEVPSADGCGDADPVGEPSIPPAFPKAVGGSGSSACSCDDAGRDCEGAAAEMSGELARRTGEGGRRTGGGAGPPSNVGDDYKQK